MSDDVYLCPRCQLGWKTVAMEPSLGSWTLRRVLICRECDLWDYPDEGGTRRFGRPKKAKPHELRRLT